MSKKCKENNILCDYKEIDNICSFESHCGKQIIITNAMKIRAMSDEELAEFLDILAMDCSDEECESCKINKRGYCNYQNTVDWLQSEVKE